jgi:hypothetical protein
LLQILCIYLGANKTMTDEQSYPRSRSIQITSFNFSISKLGSAITEWRGFLSELLFCSKLGIKMIWAKKNECMS